MPKVQRNRNLDEGIIPYFFFHLCSKVHKFLYIIINKQPHDKTNKMTCGPAKTQINLGIGPV